MKNEEDGKPQFYSCNCFKTDNIFLEDYKLHVSFVSEQQFRLNYQTVSFNCLCLLCNVFAIRRTMYINLSYMCKLYSIAAAAEEAWLCHGATV